MALIKPWVAAVILLLSLQTIAQEKSRRLFIGDTVPDIEFKGMYNYPHKTARLSDFKGKTVILDFWSTGCTSCIAAFPKLQNIQSEFKDDLVILLVNDQPKETEEAMAPVFRRSPILKATTLPMVLGDENYGNRSGLFPHYGIPYHVWIDKNGIIQATTKGEEATRENIEKLIKGEPLNVVKRVDAIGEPRDDKTSWLSYENGLFINNLLYYRSANLTYKHSGEETDLRPLTTLKLGDQYHSMLMKDPRAGNKAGGSAGGLNNIDGKRIGHYSRGPILSFYRRAYDVGLRPVIVEGGETLHSRDAYVYEYTRTDYSDSLAKETYRQDLENYFGYGGKLEVREIESYIIYRTDKALTLISRGGPEIWENTKSKQGIVIQNMNFGIVQNCFSDPKDKFGNLPIVMDETGIDPGKKVDMIIQGDLLNIPLLNMSLSKYGLGVRKEIRAVPVLVLRKVK